MRVLFYLLDGETNASSRHRALQYFPYLRQHGVQPFASRPVPEAVFQRLVERGHGKATEKTAFYSLFLACRLLDVLRARDFDVVVVQRDLFPFGPPWLERLLLRRNSRLVYDTDDATYLRPAFTPNTPFQRLRRFDKVAQLVSQARWVSAATEPIAAWAKRLNPNVSVVPMAVDLAEYDRVPVLAPSTGPNPPAAARSVGPLVLGWAGTAGGLRYLEALGPVLRALSERYPIVVRVISGGYRQISLPGVRLDARPWRLASALAELRTFDIGLVPLDDTPFEQAKFPFKLLQLLALGVPAVAARVGVVPSIVRDRENGLLASSPEEWRTALENLIADAALRDRLSSAGRQTVSDHYTVERVAPLLLDVLARALA